MFTKLAAFFLFIALILIIMSNYHLVNTHDGFLVIRKPEMTLENTYVDVTLWKPGDFLKHTHITSVLVKRGYENIAESVSESLDKVFN